MLAAQEREHPARVVPVAVRQAVPRRGERASVVVAGTHGKTTTSSLLAHVLADAGPRSVVPDRRRAAELPAVVAAGRGRRVRRRGRRVRHRVLRQGIEVPALPPAGRAADVGRVRSRRHLPRRGGGARRVPQADRADPGGRPARRVRGVAGRDGGRARRAFAGGDVRASRLGRRLDVRGRRRARSAGATTLDVARRGERVVSVDTNMPGIYNHENLVGMIAVASGLGVELPAIAPRCAASWACGAGRRCAASRSGVTVVDDFAHHPTAIRETVLGAQGAVRSRQADRGVRAAFRHQPAQRVPGRVRRRAVGGRRGRAGAAVRGREGAGGGAAGRRAPGRRSARARTCRRA